MKSSQVASASHHRRTRVSVVAVVAGLALPCCSTPKPPASVRPVKAPTARQSSPETDSAAWRREQPKPGPPGHYDYPIPTVTTLENGLRLYVLERPSGPVATSVIVLRGAAGEPQRKSGLASLAASLMVEATRKHRHHELSEAAESLGSTLRGEANRDYIRLSIDTLPEDLPQGLALVAESLTEPAFLDEDFLRLQKQQLDELRAERQSPTRLASLLGLRLLLGADAGNPVAGCPDAVRSLRPDDVRTWHKQWVTPSTTALFVVGPVHTQSVKDAVRRTFGSWKRRKPSLQTPVTLPALPTTQTVYLLDRPGSVQSAIFGLQQFPTRSTDGFVAREHLDNVLGGMFTSRINQNLRETHAYTYGARTTTVATKGFGLFAVSTSVETDVTAPATVEIRNELRAIRGPSATKPLSNEELDRSRADLIQSLGSHLEDSHRMAVDLEQLFVYELPSTYFADYPKTVASVSASDVSQESLRLTPEQVTFVIVGDAQQLSPALTKAGFSVQVAPDQCLGE